MISGADVRALLNRHADRASLAPGSSLRVVQPGDLPNKATAAALLRG